MQMLYLHRYAEMLRARGNGTLANDVAQTEKDVGEAYMQSYAFLSHVNMRVLDTVSEVMKDTVQGCCICSENDAILFQTNRLEEPVILQCMPTSRECPSIGGDGGW